MKSQVSITETLLIIGSLAISSLLFMTFISEVKEWSHLLSISSAESITNDIASLLSVSGASPSNITIYHQLQNPFNVSIKEKILNLSLSKTIGKAKIVEYESAKIAVNALAEMNFVKKIEIEKYVYDWKNKYVVKKIE